MNAPFDQYYSEENIKFKISTKIRYSLSNFSLNSGHRKFRHGDGQNVLGPNVLGLTT